MYLVKTTWWMRAYYPTLTWKVDTNEKALYLTFDDGPHPQATPFVLDQLNKYNAKATFFCIGQNVATHQDIYQRIVAEGHSVGNHTYKHFNGKEVNDYHYFKDINWCETYVKSNLFRPPYGSIRKSQIRELQGENITQLSGNETVYSIIMWDVLSGDFDIKLSPQKCASNVIKNAQKGSIVVFHDSTKAWDRMSYALPKVLEHFSKEGYQFKAL